MAVLSCLKYKTIPTTCLEYVHPWNSSCIDSWLGLMLHSCKYSLRTYATLYLLTTIMRRKKPSVQLVKQTLTAILQSTAFLTTHAYGFGVCLCTIRYLVGNFNVLSTAFLPAFLSSLVAIQIERPSRRPILCLYVTNIASETLFRMAVDRGWVSPINHGQVAIFALSMTYLLYRFRGSHAPDSMFDLIRFVIGKKEEIPRELTADPTGEVAHTESPQSSRSAGVGLPFINSALAVYKAFLQRVKCGSRASCCPHKHSCLHYTIQGGLRTLAIGYGVQVALRTVLSLRKIWRKPSLLASNLVSNNVINLGAFLGLYSATFRGVSCLLRRLRGEDSQTHAIPAGLLASLAFFFYPDNTAALYVMWKSLQVMYRDAVDAGQIPDIPYGTILLYCFSTAVLFHGCFLEPQNMRPAYVKFMDGLSGGRSIVMSRIPLDAFGLNTSQNLSKVCKQLKINENPRFTLRIFGQNYPTIS